jgi:hypothetical protein
MLSSAAGISGSLKTDFPPLSIPGSPYYAMSSHEALQAYCLVSSPLALTILMSSLLPKYVTGKRGKSSGCANDTLWTSSVNIRTQVYRKVQSYQRRDTPSLYNVIEENV